MSSARVFDMPSPTKAYKTIRLELSDTAASFLRFTSVGSKRSATDLIRQYIDDRPEYQAYLKRTEKEQEAVLRLSNRAEAPFQAIDTESEEAKELRTMHRLAAMAISEVSDKEHAMHVVRVDADNWSRDMTAQQHRELTDNWIERYERWLTNPTTGGKIGRTDQQREFSYFIRWEQREVE